MTLSNSYRRRWFQFRLRTLLLVTIAFNIAFCWVAFKLKQARTQREAVEAVLHMRGQVFYRYSQSPFGTGASDTPLAPEWLTKALGDDFWGDVVRVDIYHHNDLLNDKLERLEQFSQLKNLTLWNDSLSDDDLAHCTALSQLENLNLGGNRITDSGIVHVLKLKHLTSLNLWMNRITDSGVARLSGLTQLTDLNLGLNPITDVGARHLVHLTNLKSLCLEGTSVTDGSLEPLKQLKQLRSLNLSRTTVSGSLVNELQTALPNCVITWERFSWKKTSTRSRQSFDARMHLASARG